MIQYPILFETKSESAPGLDQTWQVQSANMQLTCAIPPEFEGGGGGLSPEDLFAQALTNCFIATFKVYAHHSRLEFKKVKAQAKLWVDLGEKGKPVMKKLKLHANIVGANNPTKAKTLGERAFQQGFILNSVKTDLEFELLLTEE